MNENIVAHICKAASIIGVVWALAWCTVQGPQGDGEGQKAWVSIEMEKDCPK